MRPLSVLDSAFLYLETRDTPMHVGSAHLYDVPPRLRRTWFERAKRHVASRLHLAPVFTRRLASLPWDVACPVWVQDRRIDLDWHIRRVRLPKPGTPAQFDELVAKLHARRLDRRRPLWRFFVIEGLASGQVGWYSQVHHAALDGAAGVLLAKALLDTEPTPRAVPPPEREREGTPGTLALLSVALSKSAGDLARLVRSLPGLAGVVRGGFSGKSGPTAGAPARGLPIGPPTPLNVAITAGRTFAGVNLPLAEVKAIAKRHGATVNDVVLALVSGMLRRYLAGRGEIPGKPLVAAMPVSLRAEGDTEYTTRATMVLANLATHLADPRARLAAIQASAGHAKAITGRARSVIPTDLLSLGAPWWLAAVGRGYGYSQALKGWTPLANVVVSNVPGPPVPLYLAGARMLTYWPTSIVEHGLGLNVTVESYCGSLDFGLVAARKAVPDIAPLAQALREAHAELAALRPRPRRRARP